MKLKQENLDALIISSSPNISYLTGFISRDSLFLISRRGNTYITDSRYIEEAKNNLQGATAIKKINGSIFKIIADTCKGLNIKRIGFEGRYLPFDEYKKIKEELNKPRHQLVYSKVDFPNWCGGKDLELISTHGLIEELRQIKRVGELKKIKKAVKITIDALTFIKGFILPGRKEIEVAAELERFIRHKGACGSAFNIIVASGPNSSFPHHLTSQRKIKNNEPVLIDIGVDYLGYKSDLTRVFFLGTITSAVRRIYGIVLGAQDRAIRKIKPGININKIDAAARQYITQKGYGGFFGHSLGHGIGLEVHEEPRISAKEKGILKPGMLFTIEPAIYLPERFGIRIEDMVLVTDNGCEVLSGALYK